jgi:hypothetical protein
MKRILFVSFLSLLFGCQNLPSQTSSNVNLAQASQESEGCPEQPEGRLDDANVKALSLGERSHSESGVIKKGQSQGFTFEGQKGQQFNYQTDNDLCVWIYTPENQLLESTTLPVTGRYLIQVSVPKGSGTFELAMSLESQKNHSSDFVRTASDTSSSSNPVNTYSSKSNSSVTRSQFSSEDYPKIACGDSKPNDPDVYPVSFYPVNVPFTEANLATSQAYFCRDAFKKRSKDTGEKVIQIASFLSESEAREFASFVQSQIPDAIVGSPTVVYE